ncbi:uncharacterized protein LOC144328842 [Podarcis muralis]
MAPKKVANRSSPATAAKRPIRGPSQALRSPPAGHPVGRVQSLVESMAGDPAALSRFAADMDGFLQQRSTQPSTSGRQRPAALAASPASPSSSEDGGEGSSSGGLISNPQLSQSLVLPAGRGQPRRSGRSTRRASRRSAPLVEPARRRASALQPAGVASGSGISRTVSVQSVSVPSQLEPESESSVEDSLPVPARKSLGGKRRQKKSSRKRAKRRRDDTSSSYSGLAAVRTWMVGHSIVHWAGVEARQFGLGPGLGLPPHVQVSWLTRRGILWPEFLPLMRRQLGVERPPTAIVIQLGENDLVSMDCLSLRTAILGDLDVLRAMVPTAKIFWSKFLQRRVWRGSRCPDATEKARKRINSAVSKKIFELGGDVIAHPEIRFQVASLFRDDGVHLSASGNKVWLGAVVAKLRAWLGL